MRREEKKQNLICCDIKVLPSHATLIRKTLRVLSMSTGGYLSSLFVLGQQLQAGL